MVERSKESVKDGGEIKALLWYQGESDTSSTHDAKAYQANMERLIENVREDLNLPSLPFSQLPNVVCVDAKGLSLKEDNLHLTTEAQVKLGHMLAQTYLHHFAPSNPPQVA
ncbi:carbohydrate esterase [Tripterygium wilfordii]|uniref:Carbohydrate esterase n=1 Tax=Tripterygium wilfordii TaxID=458696 RepID=A0A7J7BZE0_TRIWF|nr:carbohydrate esterase [Tripterygium wilfordii]